MNPLNLLKKSLLDIFNKVSLYYMRDAVNELDRRHSDKSYEDLRKIIGRAGKFGEWASRFGDRSVTSEDISTASQLCMARTAQELLGEIERSGLFKLMNLLRDAKGPIIEVLSISQSIFDARVALYAINDLQKICYEITDRLRDLLARAEPSDSDDDSLSRKITGIMDRMGFWSENFPSDDEFKEFMVSVNEWLRLTIEDKKERLKGYTSPCPK